MYFIQMCADLMSTLLCTILHFTCDHLVIGVYLQHTVYMECPVHYGLTQGACDIRFHAPDMKCVCLCKVVCLPTLH